MEMCKRIIDQHLSFLAEEFDCARVQEDTIVITTPYQYPDFDLIQIYVRDTGDGRLEMSDMGEALRHVIAMCGHDVFASQKPVIQEIVNSYRLRIGKTGSVSAITSYDEVGEASFRLSQAVKEIASLVHTARAQRNLTFRDEVRTHLKKLRLGFEANKKMKGKVLEHRVDLFVPVQGGKGGNVIQVIGGNSRTERAKDAYIIFDDLLNARSPVGRLALVDKESSSSQIKMLKSKVDDIIFLDKQERDEQLVERLKA